MPLLWARYASALFFEWRIVIDWIMWKSSCSSWTREPYYSNIVCRAHSLSWPLARKKPQGMRTTEWNGNSKWRQVIMSDSQWFQVTESDGQDEKVIDEKRSWMMASYHHWCSTMASKSGCRLLMAGNHEWWSMTHQWWQVIGGFIQWLQVIVRGIVMIASGREWLSIVTSQIVSEGHSWQVTASDSH